MHVDLRIIGTNETAFLSPGAEQPTSRQAQPLLRWHKQHSVCTSRAAIRSWCHDNANSDVQQGGGEAGKRLHAGYKEAISLGNDHANAKLGSYKTRHHRALDKQAKSSH
jgi:hypothetical protein